MNKLKKFLSGNIYPLLISIGGAAAWMFTGNLQMVNQGFIIGYLILAAVILALFKNTSHVIPIFLSLLFMVNIKNLGLRDIRELSFLYVVFGLVVIGLAIHVIRFRHEFNVGYLSLGFLLIAISYLLPMLYIPFSKTLLAISLVGFLYLAIYLFFRNTSYGKTEQIMKHFFFASLIILAQLIYGYTKGFLSMDLTQPIGTIVRTGLRSAWRIGDLGYGIINDVIIFFTLLVAGQVYMLFKYPKQIWLWIFPILSVIVVILSGSRGGWISWAVMLVMFYVLVIAKGTKTQIFIASALAILALVPMIVEPRIPRLLFQVFKQGGITNFDQFTSWRLTLYKDAYEIFRKFPYFGGGWTYKLQVGNSNRVNVYHSTIFHTLAISGIAGVVAVGVLMISQMALLVKKLNIYIGIASIAFLTTLFHGLMDNTVHMLIYTILTIFLFVAIERDDGIIEYEETKTFPFVLE